MGIGKKTLWLPNRCNVVQDGSDTGGKEICFGYDIEERKPDSKHAKCDEHAFHGGIMPFTRACRFQKSRIGGLRQWMKPRRSHHRCDQTEAAASFFAEKEGSWRRDS